MRKLGVILFAILFVLMIPATALAQKPEVLYSGTYSDADYPFYFQDSVNDECGFPVQIEYEETFTIKMFFDKDDNPNRIHYLTRGQATFRGPTGEETWQNYAYLVREDIFGETNSWTGNVWNVHDGTGGVLVLDSGIVVLDLSSNHEIVWIAGPHEFLDPDIGLTGLCEAIGA